MTLRLTAGEVATEVDPDNDVMAGVAEDEDGEGFILLFMSNISEPSPRQNLALGQNSQCVVMQVSNCHDLWIDGYVRGLTLVSM